MKKQEIIIEAFKAKLGQFAATLEEKSVELYLEFKDIMARLQQLESSSDLSKEKLRELRHKRQDLEEALVGSKKIIRLVNSIIWYLNRQQYQEACQPLGNLIQRLKKCQLKEGDYAPIKNVEIFLRQNFFVAQA